MDYWLYTESEKITLFLWREPSGRPLMLNLPFKRAFSLSISAQEGLFLLDISNVTAASPPDFPNYVGARVIMYKFTVLQNN